MTGEQFDALSDAEKERIYQEIDRIPPEQLFAESRAPNATERARLKRVEARIRRPGAGGNVQTIALTVEKRLLDQADAYASEKGISRAQLVAQGLCSVITPQGRR